jgi:DNA-binding transcriptional regulator GbsR (MarR family)
MTDRHTFIERMGLAAESDGFSRIAGRLFGALILEHEPRSLDDLADELAVSKASVSTEARRLVDRGVAERVTRPGDRRDYYVLAPDFFVQTIRFRLSRWAKLHTLAREMQTDLPDVPRLVRDRFAHIEEVNDFLLARVEDALREWSEHNPRGGAPRARAAARVANRQRAGTKRAKRSPGKERLG